MDLKIITPQFLKQAQVIYGLLDGISIEQARWKPDENSWSMLEVINHLYDEEKEDFRLHLEWILRRATGAWPAIDPVGWVVSRRYNERDLAESLKLFLHEREKSIHWLSELGEPDWSIVCQASFGPISAGEMFSSWLAHDLLHIRQLIEIQWYYTTRKMLPFDVRYAGEW